MESLKIEKAEDLGAMLRAFRVEPLDESNLAEFYYEDTMTNRTGDKWDSPLEFLFRDCTTPFATNAHLLLGHRGCGKSTELCKLKQRFEEYGQPAYTIDPMIETDLFKVNHWDIMLLITDGLCRIAEKKHVTIDETLLQNVFDYIKKDQEEITTVDKSASITMSGGAEVKTPSLIKLVLSAFASLTSEIKVSTARQITIKEKMEKRAADWVMYTKEISDRIAAACNNKQPIIIFDNLDKIPNPKKIFDLLRFSVLAQMPFPIIYTFPISQFYASEFASIAGLYKPHVLPMIKVSNLDKSENREGIDVMREIVGLRANLRLFDETNKVLETMIKQTGGCLRHLFECIITAAERAGRRGADKIEEEDAKRAFSGLKGELNRQISQPDYPKLTNIYKDPKYREQISDRDFLLEKMQSTVVLEYQNGDRWHDLHPLVADFLLKQGEIGDSSDR